MPSKHTIGEANLTIGTTAGSSSSKNENKQLASITVGISQRRKVVIYASIMPKGPKGEYIFRPTVSYIKPLPANVRTEKRIAYIIDIIPVFVINLPKRRLSLSKNKNKAVIPQEMIAER